MPELSSPFSLFWFAVGLVLVLAFAWTRPLTLTDFENRKLARNVSAQVFFTLLYLVLFVVLVAAFQYGGKVFVALVESAGWLGQLSQYLQRRSDQPASFAPLLALGAIGWFQSLPVLRELERTCLVYTYSARYMYTDVKELSEHLQHCVFDPTESERARNRQALERLNVFLTDSDTAPIDLKVVGDWRKVETLLRQLSAWTAEGRSVLNDPEREQLQEALTAHERKTALALNIIRMLDHVASGRSTAETMGEVTDLLSKAKAGGGGRIEAVEARIETVLEGGADDAAVARPIYLSSMQLMSFLEQIQSYFEEEYRILLRHVAELAAKCIVHSGDLASERLRTVKSAGFKGLGRILPISFNRILWVFFAVLGASFVLFVARQWLASGSVGVERVDMQRTMMMAGFISLTTALAAIVGAAVGSTRRLAQCPVVPWRTYLGAGLIAVTLFFITHGTRMMLTKGIERPPVVAAQTTADAPSPAAAAAPGTRMTPWVRPPSLTQSAPWALIPFVVTVAICLLARLPGWPLVGSSFSPAPAPPAAPRPGTPASMPQSGALSETPEQRRFRVLAERTLDGIALGLAMVAAIAVVLKAVFPMLQWLVPQSGIRLPPRMVEAMAHTWLPPSLVLMQFAIGFFIGALILREVRRAGHSRVVLTPVAAPPRTALPRAAGTLPLPVPSPSPSPVG